jgi:hypothetical protein
MKYQDIVKSVCNEIKKEVLPKLPLKDFIIKEVKSKKNYLGFYKTSSCWDIPIIKLNKRVILQGAKENDLSIYDVILTTILHELAHAIQELKGLWFNEEIAENFAYNYWDWRIVDEIN